MTRLPGILRRAECPARLAGDAKRLTRCCPGSKAAGAETIAANRSAAGVGQVAAIKAVGARPIKTRLPGKRRDSLPPEAAANGSGPMSGCHRKRRWDVGMLTSAVRGRWARARTKDGRGPRARHPLPDKTAISGVRARARRWVVATISGARCQRLPLWGAITISGARARLRADAVRTSGARGQETRAQEARRTTNGARARARRWVVAMTSGARGQPLLLLRGVDKISGARGQSLPQQGAITISGARAQRWAGAGKISGARPMDITRARPRQMTRALTCAAARAGEPSQPLRPMDNGDRAIGARQVVAGTMPNRLGSGGNPLPRRRQRLVRLNQAIVAPTPRVAWVVNRRMLAAVGVSAKRQPGKPNHVGKHRVGRQLNPRQPAHAAARAIRPRLPSGTSQPRASHPGKLPGLLVSGASLNRLRVRTPAAPSSQRAPEA
jgi:hypothetical protein